MSQKETLEEFAKAQLDAAKRIVRKGEEVRPVLIFDMPEDQRAIVAVQGYDRDRESALTAMKAMLKAKDAERYAFVMEAWFGSPPGKVPEDYLPSKDPARKECIAVSAQDSDGTKLLMVAEIKRGKRGLVQFQDWSPDRGDALGPLMDLFGKDVRQ